MAEEQHPTADTALESTETGDGMAVHDSIDDAMHGAQDEDDVGGLFGEGSDDEGAE